MSNSRSKKCPRIRYYCNYLGNSDISGDISFKLSSNIIICLVYYVQSYIRYIFIILCTLGSRIIRYFEQALKAKSNYHDTDRDKVIKIH